MRFTALLDSVEIELDLENNLYVGHKVTPRPVDFSKVAPVRYEYNEMDINVRANISDLISFKLSTSFAKRVSKLSISQIIEHAQPIMKSMNSRVSDYADIEKKLAKFRRLVTWDNSELECLGYSLACLFFMKSIGCQPKIILGVKEGPFRAHAWLEINGIIANDKIAKTCTYKPILSFDESGAHNFG